MIPDEKTLGTETDIQELVEIPIFGKKNVILDSQILTSLMNCGRLTDFRFNLNLVSIDGKGNSLECGSIVHTFLEYFYRARINQSNHEQAVAIGMAAAERYIKGCPFCTDFTPHSKADGDFIVKPECGHKVNEFPGVKNTPRESQTEPFSRTGWSHVLDTCDQYQRFRRNDHWIPLEVEVVKGEILYEDDEIRIMWKAKLDAIFDTNHGIFPVDHKTMKSNRGDNLSLNNQFTGQCLMMKVQNIIINKIGFQKTLPPDKRFIRTPISYTTERLLEWQSTILPYYGKTLLMYAESGYFPPNFTSCEGKYGNCAYHKVCESNPDDRERKIKEMFIVGPEWNPTNEDEE